MNKILDNDDGQMIPSDECGPNFLTFVLQLSKNLNKETDPTRARCFRGLDQDMDCFSHGQLYVAC